MPSSSQPLRRCRQAGFTYVWMLLLVALLGLGTAVGLDVAATAEQRERERELLAIGRQFRNALGRYYSRHSAGMGEYPASLDDLLKDNRTPGITRHLRKVFVDPMTGKAEWGEVRLNGRLVGLHSLSTRTPIKQDRFEPDDMSFRNARKISDWVFTYPPDLLLRLPPDTASGLAPAASAAVPPPLP
ncbi:type II secretion system protein [Eleftheria terrae]|uniref:type II secretion system protein n=1 Tax=Eleftheria terrae TaxID=1597781 RepID=UPI00263BCE1A|nr:type II secretion system protein [Eleftheria terrae]WKB55268.1 type II secretion system protein [Eleftheria terrae]